MSVLIKGMKMPKSCDECLFCDDGGMCAALQIDLLGDGEELENSWYIPEGYKSDRCPLMEIPDHGDLIDRSKLKDEFIGDAFSGKGGYAVWSEDILSAPVVIPAERSEE